MVLVYVDIISKAEMLDDKMLIEEEYNGHIYKVKAKMVVDEDNDEEEVKVVDVAHNFRYSTFGLDKKGFLLFIKKYLKNIKTHLASEGKDAEYIKSFEKNAGTFIKYLIPKFKSCEFYRNEKDEVMDGALGIAVWVDDADCAPTFFWFKDGLKVVKA